MTPLYFRIYLSESSAIRVTAQIEEYEPRGGTWLVSATGQLWRMARMRGGTGELIGLGALGERIEARARGKSIDEALQTLAHDVESRICNALTTEH